MERIRIGKEKIYIDGKPEKIVSGAMHYFRIHPEYWRDRLLKLKECGCNCVETYVAWNLHEKEEGKFDFSGWLDLGAYLDLAKELGLYAIVRPGPYICSEWDFGGMPWWLLKESDIRLRCLDPIFIKKITPYLERVCEIVRPRAINTGGNVIFVQIENEYGSYGNDKGYLLWYKSFYEEQKLSCPLITSDGETKFLLNNGALEGVMASVNYRWDSVRCVASLLEHHGNQPGAVMELWNGKGQQWSVKFERRDLDEVEASVKTALENAELVNMYMFHGGTSFGFMNGALEQNGKFLPQMTSYDVDAPIDEYGRRTPKYYREQKVITEHLGKEINNTQTDPEIASYTDIRFVGEAKLTPALTRKTKSTAVKSMEQYDQGYGYIVYSTKAYVGKDGAELILPEVHDFAHVYIDGEYRKSVYRNDSDNRVEINTEGTRRIDVLVENLGRINFGPKLFDRKGLIGDLHLFDREYGLTTKLFGFDIYSIELNTLPESFEENAENNAPAFYKYEFNTENPKDTVLFPEGFTRGVAFINGFNLGRHWTVENSENKLFIPAPLIKKGVNSLVIFDVLANGKEKSVTLGLK